MHPVASTIGAPVIRQQLRNNCEATALSIVLATSGVRVSQRTLQSQLTRSGPADPQGSGSARVWGDPDLGFVGRPDGGGVAGGFGVYPKPIAALALRHRRKLRNLTGHASSALYAHLLHGHAVMAWVALSSGPFSSWRSPQGRRIRVSFAEHTVALVGLSGQTLRVVNPLSGQLERWSRHRFESMWAGLGHRALAL